MLTLMLDLHYKGLGLVIQHVGKENTQQITSEYDHQILLSFLVYAYNYLNQRHVNAQAPNFIPQNNHKSIWPFGDWRRNGIVSGEKAIESLLDQKSGGQRVQRSTCVVEIAWITIFLC